MYFFYKPSNLNDNNKIQINILQNNDFKTNYIYINNLKQYIKDNTDIYNNYEDIILLYTIFKNIKLKNTIYKFIYKLRTIVFKNKISINNTDLCYDEFSVDDNVLELYHNKKKWKFTYNDITKMLINNLTNYTDYLNMFIKYPFNPYNFTSFDIQHLAVIYDFLKNFKCVSPIIYLFKQSNYNLSIFINVNYKYIFNYIYTNNIYFCDNDELYFILFKFINIYYTYSDNINKTKLYHNIDLYKPQIITLILQIAKYSHLTPSNKCELIADFFDYYPIFFIKRKKYNNSSSSPSSPSSTLTSTSKN